VIEVFVAASYIALCVLVGKIATGKVVIGYHRRIGFWTGFYVSLLLTPLLVFLVLLWLPDRDAEDSRKENGSDE